MDIQGAAELQRRIAEQANWRSARAVKAGQQPSADPDRDLLESFDEQSRLYAGGMRKRLVDGWWRTLTS
jgi:hypothetical protein